MMQFQIALTVSYLLLHGLTALATAQVSSNSTTYRIHDVGSYGISDSSDAEASLISSVRARAPIYRIQDLEGDEATEFEPEFESPWDEPIETERHDFTQSPKVVGCGVRQFEYGFFFATRGDGAERETTYATPELLFRFGLTDRLELRARFNYAWKLNNEDDDFDGGEDLRLSTKIQVTELCDWIPDSALELRMSVPTGGGALTTGRWEPGLDYIYGWEFGEYFTLTGSTGANKNAVGDVAFITVDTDPDDQFFVYTQSAAVGTRLNEKATLYAEWFGLFSDGRDEEVSQGYLNLGVDYLINQNVVVDFRAGWGLTPDADDLFTGVGGAFRF